MEQFSAYTILFAICGLIVLSYLFSLANRFLRIPSILMLLGTGILLRYIFGWLEIPIYVPPGIVEVLGTIGLIMIVLEAGLDLEVTRERLPLIRRAFWSGLIIFLVSAITVAGLILWFIPGAPLVRCLVYALPLSIVSSAIVFPSVHHLKEQKKQFLIYEVAFCDVLGIMVFNFFTTEEQLNFQSVTWFIGSIPVALVLSVGICYVLLTLLLNSRVNVRFFLLFAVLIIVYESGRLMHLPSLLVILAFGLAVNNWELLRWKPLHRALSVERVNNVTAFLKSITAETSFLVRTFFFILFGFSIDLSFLQDRQVILFGSSIVTALLVLRFIYLRILHRHNLLPELFYIPRGLITILLFYKIPAWLRLDAFDEGVMFFVILSTSLIMMLGSFLYRDRPVKIKEALTVGDKKAGPAAGEEGNTAEGSTKPA